MPVDIPAILDGTGRTISFLARRAASFPVAVYRRVTGKTQPVLGACCEYLTSDLGFGAVGLKRLNGLSADYGSCLPNAACGEGMQLPPKAACTVRVDKPHAHALNCLQPATSASL